MDFINFDIDNIPKPNEDEDVNSIFSMSKEELMDVKYMLQELITFAVSDKIQTSFIPAFKNFTINGRLYGNYNIFGAKSFRLTSNQPNLLNLPSSGTVYAKPVKEALIAPAGKIIYQVDLSALEDRVIANLSKDKNKLSIFLKGVDGHCLNSYAYFRKEIEAILPREENETDDDYLVRYKTATKSIKELDKIRSKSKAPTFGLNYGMQPKKLSKTLKISLAEAEQLYNAYHNNLYPEIAQFKQRVLAAVKAKTRIDLGLGCTMKSFNIRKDERTLFNACSQFWSVLTLVAIHEVHKFAKEENLDGDIKVISSIYDSIYIEVTDNPDIITKLNEFIIPVLTTDFIEGQVVANEAEGEVGYDWYNVETVKNNASLENVASTLNKMRSKQCMKNMHSNK